MLDHQSFSTTWIAILLCIDKQPKSNCCVIQLVGTAPGAEVTRVIVDATERVIPADLWRIFGALRDFPSGKRVVYFSRTEFRHGLNAMEVKA